jgi:hypothetical protein
VRDSYFMLVLTNIYRAVAGDIYLYVWVHVCVCISFAIYFYFIVIQYANKIYFILFKCENFIAKLILV